jgi:hypothetical protein
MIAQMAVPLESSDMRIAAILYGVEAIVRPSPNR